ncbi:hypothetical protein ASPCAL10069 [Aspergillus calidoustus]|uniref:Clr5 domain-containing protein n=1 Tax=Aspergillus calidoustus TaxID=454130 RepID=A0A0U5GZU5_ASPCI|nr:hypothetical protein ASPCAL10069 [Aspergillus calidoustus]
MPPHAPAIADEVWARHREEIIAFYQSSSLPKTMAYMVEKHNFRASKNQYIRMLDLWGIKKNHPGKDWIAIAKVKRKRSKIGKESEVSIHGRKRTRQQVEKEIARHVPLLELCCSPGDVVLPDYISVSTPLAQPVGVSRERLLLNLPWYQYGREIQAFVSGERQTRIRASASLQPSKDLPQLSVRRRSCYQNETCSSELFLSAELESGHSPTQLLSREKDSPSVFKVFLQRFIFLAINNLIWEGDFKKVCDWIVEKCGADTLLVLCRLDLPSMKVFATRCFAVLSSLEI